MYLTIFFCFFSLISAQTCKNDQGPCLNEFCPGEGHTCIGGIACCAAEDIVNEETGPSEVVEPVKVIPVETVPPVAPTAPPTIQPIKPVTSTCVDNVKANCPNLKNYCNVEQYKDLLSRQCPLTCNKCGSQGNTGSNNRCADVPTANCYRYTALCNNPTYRLLLTKNCPRTCNLCLASRPILQRPY